MRKWEAGDIFRVDDNQPNAGGWFVVLNGGGACRCIIKGQMFEPGKTASITKDTVGCTYYAPDDVPDHVSVALAKLALLN
jgi:hypothetical protein